MPSSTFLTYVSRPLKPAKYLSLRNTRTTLPNRAAQRRLFSDQSPLPHGTSKGTENAYHPNNSSNQNSNTSGKESKDSKARSTHAQWYSDTVPAMIPIALLGSAVYIGLQLVRTKLATEKYLDEANARIAQLEEEIKRLQSEHEEEEARTRNSEYPGVKKRKEPSKWWWFGA